MRRHPTSQRQPNAWPDQLPFGFTSTVDVAFNIAYVDPELKPKYEPEHQPKHLTHRVAELIAVHKPQCQSIAEPKRQSNVVTESCPDAATHLISLVVAVDLAFDVPD